MQPDLILEGLPGHYHLDTVGLCPFFAEEDK